KLTGTQAITDGANAYGLTLAGSGVLSIKSSGNSLFTLSSSGATLDINGGAVNVRDTDGNIYDATFAAPVTVENGGTLTLAGGNLQINGGASNVITLDGSTSSITGANLFTLGNSGTSGSLHASHGATISSTFLTVGGIGTGGQACVATIDSGASVTNS